VVGHDPALDHHGDDVGLGDLDGPQGDPAVVDQQRVTGPHVTGKAVVGRRHAVPIPGDVIDGDGETLAVDESDGAGGETAGADLGALQVDEHTHRPVRLVAGLAHLGIGRLV